MVVRSRVRENLSIAPGDLVRAKETSLRLNTYEIFLVIQVKEIAKHDVIFMLSKNGAIVHALSIDLFRI